MFPLYVLPLRSHLLYKLRRPTRLRGAEANRKVEETKRNRFTKGVECIKVSAFNAHSLNICIQTFRLLSFTTFYLVVTKKRVRAAEFYALACTPITKTHKCHNGKRQN